MGDALVYLDCLIREVSFKGKDYIGAHLFNGFKGGHLFNDSGKHVVWRLAFLV